MAVQWSEAMMDIVFSRIFEDLKGQDITQKKQALEYISQYVLQVGPSSAGSVFRTNLLEVVEKVLDIHEHCWALTLEASKFWNYYLHNQWPLEEQFLSRIVQVLLVNLSYEEDDYALCNVELSLVENSYPYIEEIIEHISLYGTPPSLHRQYTASALNKLAYVFKPHILQSCIKLIKENVMNTNIAGWKKETVILALGLISAPCKDALVRDLSELAPWMPLNHHIPLVKKTTRWAISQCQEVYLKVCPMLQITCLRKENPAIRYITSRYFTDWVEAGLAPDNYNQREDRITLSQKLDNFSPHSISRNQELIVLKLMWESQTQDPVMPDSWMSNFARFLETRPVFNEAPQSDFYEELNPALHEQQEAYFTPRPNFSTILMKSIKKSLIPSLAKEGSIRWEFLRLCSRITMGLHILGIHGSRLIDDTSIAKFFMPYMDDGENWLDPFKFDRTRKKIFNHIHMVPAEELWGFEIIRYEYNFAGIKKFYFQLNG